MSTILKTLKKLEKDKSELQKDLDLKEMVIHSEGPSYLRMQEKELKKACYFAGLGVCGALMGASIIYLFTQGSSEAPDLRDPAPIDRPAAQKTSLTSAPQVFQPGFSLSDIPEDSRFQEREDDAFSTAPPAQSEAPRPKPISKKPAVPEPTAPDRAAPDPAPAKEIQAHLNPAPRPEARRPASPAPTQATQQTPSAAGAPSAGSISGLKIKGIIFFSAGNRANHIFVSTQQDSNKKLRLGDTVQGAVLESIEPSRAIFSYGNRSIVVGLGE
ncbi:MAG: hypothetical protein G3M78_04615 [Candidatus Nitrohelix vancouverensis]|uniref:Uncharacterized protein n=1 Tax=Candidatus Nitrohelix vancouverensis TaxID=2705534 RepID=A0A7T0C198_9BACT|nr:MAG: hypothetical protein G3M78_04615 [Candidatus Nitrohelix vancouverensis]